MATPPSNGCKSDRGYALYLSTVTVDKTSHIRCNRDAFSEGIAVPSCTYLETTMQKLLEKYRANPTAIRHAAVISYHRKHPFCECFLSESDLALVRLLTSITN